MDQNDFAFWSVPAPEVLRQLGTSPSGLTPEEARRRLAQLGPEPLRGRGGSPTLTLFLSQFKSPIILILLFAAALSLFLHDRTDALIIFMIILLSGLLSFWQEKGATEAVNKLLAMVQVKAEVLRDGGALEVPIGEIAPGDIVLLNAGDVIPGDCLTLESTDLFVDEAALTGETYPAEKTAGLLPSETPLRQRTNALFLGTHVISGSAKAVVVRTGHATEFGRISQHLKLRPPETEFERGIRRFGFLLLEVTLLLVITIFAVNVYLSRPVLDSFLFALALAVGLTPQLLPAIISINLSHGAKRMAERRVIVKRLASIENFGSMNVLCSDKTGTLTEGVVQLHSALDVDGRESEKVLRFAYLNASFQKGFTNPLDEGIRRHRSFDVSAYRKMGEVPYDFLRKRLSVLVAGEGRQLMITKGALSPILSVCSSVERGEGRVEEIAPLEGQIRGLLEEFSRQGFRTLGVAYREMGSASAITKDDERDMTFLGFLILFDPPKPEITETIERLSRLGISLKIITGDSSAVAASIAQRVGLGNADPLTGADLRKMSDEALTRRVNEAEVFAEVEPNQKERVILALKKAGNVVGFLGDGINDATALHAADVGISVDSGVDIAKEAADIVLLEKDLGVLEEGVREGRTTFANTLKYVFMATSANFGNMFSMAGASLFLPFLPLLPKQILLTNLLTDLPEMTIATDRVDRELTHGPRRWNIRFIRNFMITFGLVSSVFDYLTFGVLLWVLKAGTLQFRTGWFLESVISASVIVLVIRTRRPFFRSRPSGRLLTATLLTIVVTLLLPFTPLTKVLGFSPVPASFLLWLGMILGLYVLGTEMAKGLFYRKASH